MQNTRRLNPESNRRSLGIGKLPSKCKEIRNPLQEFTSFEGSHKNPGAMRKSPIHTAAISLFIQIEFRCAGCAALTRVLSLCCGGVKNTLCRMWAKPLQGWLVAGVDLFSSVQLSRRKLLIPQMA